MRDHYWLMCLRLNSKYGISLVFDIGKYPFVEQQSLHWIHHNMDISYITLPLCLSTPFHSS
jgi:hypothetical protein